MANRKVQSVYIIDTASGNVTLPGSAGKFATVAFWSSDTAGKFEITGTNTSDVLIKLQNATQQGGGSSAEAVNIDVSGVYFEDIKVPVLQSGTAWIYYL